MIFLLLWKSSRETRQRQQNTSQGKKKGAADKGVHSAFAVYTVNIYNF